MIDVEITAKKISLLPSTAALRIGKPFSSFLKIFSVTTMPSSTTKPVASTIPSSVKNINGKARNVHDEESGDK